MGVSWGNFYEEDEPATEVERAFRQGVKGVTKRPSITCPACGMTSYHPDDIAQRYCGNCHAFHAVLGIDG